MLGPAGQLRFESDFSRGKAKVREGSPYRNAAYLVVDGKIAATIEDYTLSWRGFDSSQSVTCTTEHPEVYGVRAVTLPSTPKES
jgi:hypothetical protein